MRYHGKGQKTPMHKAVHVPTEMTHGEHQQVQRTGIHIQPTEVPQPYQARGITQIGQITIYGYQAWQKQGMEVMEQDYGKYHPIKDKTIQVPIIR